MSCVHSFTICKVAMHTTNIWFFDENGVRACINHSAAFFSCLLLYAFSVSSHSDHWCNSKYIFHFVWQFILHSHQNNKHVYFIWLKITKGLSIRCKFSSDDIHYRHKSFEGSFLSSLILCACRLMDLMFLAILLIRNIFGESVSKKNG